MPPGGWTSRGIAEGIPVDVLAVVLPDGTLVNVAGAVVLVGAKMMELGTDIVVAESVPVGTREMGGCENVEVVDGTEVVVLACAVVADVYDCIGIDSLVGDTLLTVDVDGASEEIGKIADVVVGTRAVTGAVDEVLAGTEMMGVSTTLLELKVKVASVVKGAVGVMTGADDAVTVPFDGTVEDGSMRDVRPVSMGMGTKDAPDVLKEYEPVEIPVPVMVAVAEALDDASDDAALDKIPENSEDSDEETAGFVATMLES